jgi:hypothetical protein
VNHAQFQGKGLPKISALSKYIYTSSLSLHYPVPVEPNCLILCRRGTLARQSNDSEPCSVTKGKHLCPSDQQRASKSTPERKGQGIFRFKQSKACPASPNPIQKPTPREPLQAPLPRESLLISSFPTPCTKPLGKLTQYPGTKNTLARVAQT